MVQQDEQERAYGADDAHREVKRSQRHEAAERREDEAAKDTLKRAA